MRDAMTLTCSTRPKSLIVTRELRPPEGGSR